MKTGDIVMWKWNGKLNPEMVGVITSDYTESTSEDGSIIKNVYWCQQMWIRPIEQKYLEVINNGI